MRELCWESELENEKRRLFIGTNCREKEGGNWVLGVKVKVGRNEIN